MDIQKIKGIYLGSERRLFFRIIYPPPLRPIFRIPDRVFLVNDISQRGLGVINSNRDKIDWLISGELVFSNMEPIAVEGVVVRRQQDQFGLSIKPAISRNLMDREKQNVEEYLDEILKDIDSRELL